MNTVQQVKQGNFSHDWMTVVSEDEDNHIEFRMSLFGVRIKELLDVVTPVELSQILPELNAVAPTAYLLDLRALQSKVKTEPVTLWPKYKGHAMKSPAAVKEHTAKLDKQVGTQSVSGGVSVFGKHWIHPLELERLYGAHVMTDLFSWRGIKLHPCISGDAFLKVIQPISSFHKGPSDLEVDGEHEDYMMTICVVHEQCKVNGRWDDTLRVYNDSKFSKLVWGSEPRKVAKLGLHEPWRIPDATIGERRLLWAGYQYGLDIREIAGTKHNPAILDYSKHCRRGGKFLGVRGDGMPIWEGGNRLALPRDEDPWCAAFASCGLLCCLYPGETPPHDLRVSVRELAQSGLDRGTLRLADSGYEPLPGDLALLGRRGQNPLPGSLGGNAGLGHVRAFVRRIDSKQYQGIGGNESNAIGWGPHKFSDVLAWVNCND